MEFAVRFAKVPLPVRGVHEVDESVERGHGRVRKRQVEQEVVGDRPHALVRQDDPDDDQVAEHGHCQNEAVGDRPERHAPRRLHELAGVVGRRVGTVVGRRHPLVLALKLVRVSARDSGVSGE